MKGVRRLTFIGTALAGLAGVSALIRRRVDRGRYASDIAASLRTPLGAGVFNRDMVAMLPEPVTRFFLHAIAEGTPLATSAWLKQQGAMSPSPGGPRFTIRAEETLAPPRGLVWKAEALAGPLALDVIDMHLDGSGTMSGAMWGMVPVMDAGGSDVSRSSRHRVVAESIWVPSALLPSDRVSWTAEGPNDVTCTLTIDGEDVPFHLSIDGDGRVSELTMERFGDAGVTEWQLIPYGFSVEAERTFSGYTIPSSLTGGWWYGTDRYDKATATHLEVVDARFS